MKDNTSEYIEELQQEVIPSKNLKIIIIKLNLYLDNMKNAQDLANLLKDHSKLDTEIVLSPKRRSTPTGKNFC